MKYLITTAMLIANFIQVAYAEVIYDEARDRNIPVEITFPTNNANCTAESKCPVAFLSAGYGVKHLKYKFLSDELNELGYLVIAIGHELPSDPPLSTSGNLFETRSENWRRGAETLNFIKVNIGKRMTSYNFEKLLLVGHSNGGDISAWLGNNKKAYITSMITLDHRRVPIPRSEIETLSIRASDFPADDGVLPTRSEQIKYGSCVVKIPNAKHNDMSDYGPDWLKTKIRMIVRRYLDKIPCDNLLNTNY